MKNIIIISFLFISFSSEVFPHSEKGEKRFGYIEGEIYNPCKVTKDTFGAIKNERGNWVLPIGHPMLSLIEEGYMIHPKKPNVVIPNPYSKAGRKLIASLKPKYAPSRGFKTETKHYPSDSNSHYKEQGIASDFLREKRANAKK